jgi:hypothetical protein
MITKLRSIRSCNYFFYFLASGVTYLENLDAASLSLDSTTFQLRRDQSLLERRNFWKALNFHDPTTDEVQMIMSDYKRLMMMEDHMLWLIQKMTHLTSAEHPSLLATLTASTSKNSSPPSSSATTTTTTTAQSGGSSSDATTSTASARYQTTAADNVSSNAAKSLSSSSNSSRNSERQQTGATSSVTAARDNETDNDASKKSNGDVGLEFRRFGDDTTESSSGTTDTTNAISTEKPVDEPTRVESPISFSNESSQTNRSKWKDLL